VSSVLLRQAQHIAPWFSFFLGFRSGLSIKVILKLRSKNQNPKPKLENPYPVNAFIFSIVLKLETWNF
jgi:hypothetical protein